LFLALLSTGFHGLLRLSELTFPGNPTIQDWRKVTKRTSVLLHAHKYLFSPPAHKADCFFAGNRVLIRAINPSIFDPVHPFLTYLTSRDHLFPSASPLWLTPCAIDPTRFFFLFLFQDLLAKIFWWRIHKSRKSYSFSRVGYSFSTHSCNWISTIHVAWMATSVHELLQH